MKPYAHPLTEEAAIRQTDLAWAGFFAEARRLAALARVRRVAQQRGAGTELA